MNGVIMGKHKQPIFIVGTQRSGTTLLRLILNAHSQIAIPEEATFLIPLLKKKFLHRKIEKDSLTALIRYLSLNAQFKLWNYDSRAFLSQLSQKNGISLRDLIDGLFSSYCDSRGKKIWGDKTPSFFRKLDILSALFPDAKFIHIIRDGRDVFDSWRRMDPSKGNAAVTALDWRYKLFRIEKSFTGIPESNKIIIRYEDLIDGPYTTIKAVCRMIGINYEDRMLDFYKTSHEYIGTHHSELIFKPIDRENKYKWKKNLSLREIVVFNLLSKHCLKKNGYEIKGRQVKLTDLFSLLISLFLGLPMRMMRILQTKNVLERSIKKGRSIDSLYSGKPPKGIQT